MTVPIGRFLDPYVYVSLTPCQGAELNIISMEEIFNRNRCVSVSGSVHIRFALGWVAHRSTDDSTKVAKS